MKECTGATTLNHAWDITHEQRIFYANRLKNYLSKNGWAMLDKALSWEYWGCLEKTVWTQVQHVISFDACVLKHVKDPSAFDCDTAQPWMQLHLSLFKYRQMSLREFKDHMVNNIFQVKL